MKTSQRFVASSSKQGQPCHRTALHIITTGEASTAATYREVAGEIVEAARGHYNGEYIYECHGREKDGAVIHAIITFGE